MSPSSLTTPTWIICLDEQLQVDDAQFCPVVCLSCQAPLIQQYTAVGFRYYPRVTDGEIFTETTEQQRHGRISCPQCRVRLTHPQAVKVEMEVFA